MKLLVPGLLLVALVGGIFSRWQEKDEPDRDQQVLDQLKKAGSDLSKPHNIELFLYLPTEDLANQGDADVRLLSAESDATIEQPPRIKDSFENTRRI